MITTADTHSALMLFHLRAAELHAEARRRGIARAAGAVRATGAASPRHGRLRRWIMPRHGPLRRHGGSESRAPALP
jgi:hypothetical protein